MERSYVLITRLQMVKRPSFACAGRSSAMLCCTVAVSSTMLPSCSWALAPLPSQPLHWQLKLCCCGVCSSWNRWNSQCEGNNVTIGIAFCRMLLPAFLLPNFGQLHRSSVPAAKLHLAVATFLIARSVVLLRALSVAIPISAASSCKEGRLKGEVRML
jgi:hypothetical protein